MNEKEVPQASRALVNWFRSQDLSPHEAVALMVHTVAAILRTGHVSAQDASKMVGETIREIMEDK